MVEILLGIVLLCGLFFVLLMVVVGASVWLFRRRSSAASLVSPAIRRALNADLERVTIKKHVDTAKRDWMEADGYTVEG